MSPGPSPRARWTLALLFLAGVLNMFDRQIINVLAQPIKQDLAISDAQLGLLTGAAFGVFYALLGMPLARLADRVDRTRLIAASLVLWSVFTAACGFARSFAELFVARLAVGVGEAGSQPASAALVADLFPPARRGLAMSLLLAGVPVGAFLGLLVGGLAGQLWGWRIAFTLAGLPGLALAVVMLATLRDRRAPAGTGAGGGRAALAAVGALLRRPGYLALVLGNVCSTFAVYASGAWLPPFFIRVHHMTLAEIGAFAALAVGVGGGLGTLLGGLACDLLRPRLRRPETVVLTAVSLLCVPFLVIAVMAQDRTLALAAMFAFDVFAYAFLPAMVRASQEAADEGTRALAIGVTSSIATIVSLGVGLPLVGAVSDALAPAHGPRAIGYALALASAASLAGALAYARAGRALARTEDGASCPT
jgi:predicted MFS family arabinose efflux permease